MTEDVHSSDQPFDRLTQLADDITHALDHEPGVKGMVFLTDGDRSGIKMSGYEDPIEGAVDLFMHMKAMFNAAGKDLSFIGIPDSPEGI